MTKANNSRIKAKSAKSAKSAQPARQASSVVAPLRTVDSEISQSKPLFQDKGFEKIKNVADLIMKPNGEVKKLREMVKNIIQKEIFDDSNLKRITDLFFANAENTKKGQGHQEVSPFEIMSETLKKGLNYTPETTLSIGVPEHSSILEKFEQSLKNEYAEYLRQETETKVKIRNNYNAIVDTMSNAPRYDWSKIIEETISDCDKKFKEILALQIACLCSMASDQLLDNFSLRDKMPYQKMEHLPDAIAQELEQQLKSNPFCIIDNILEGHVNLDCIKRDPTVQEVLDVIQKFQLSLKEKVEQARSVDNIANHNNKADISGNSHDYDERINRKYDSVAGFITCLIEKNQKIIPKILKEAIEGLSQNDTNNNANMASLFHIAKARLEKLKQLMSGFNGGDEHIKTTAQYYLFHAIEEFVSEENRNVEYNEGDIINVLGGLESLLKKKVNVDIGDVIEKALEKKIKEGINKKVKELPEIIKNMGDRFIPAVRQDIELQHVLYSYLLHHVLRDLKEELPQELKPIIDDTELVHVVNKQLEKLKRFSLEESRRTTLAEKQRTMSLFVNKLKFTHDFHSKNEEYQNNLIINFIKNVCNSKTVSKESTSFLQKFIKFNIDPYLGVMFTQQEALYPREYKQSAAQNTGRELILYLKFNDIIKILPKNWNPIGEESEIFKDNIKKICGKSLSKFLNSIQAFLEDSSFDKFYSEDSDKRNYSHILSILRQMPRDESAQNSPEETFKMLLEIMSKIKDSIPTYLKSKGEQKSVDELLRGILGDSAGNEPKKSKKSKKSRKPTGNATTENTKTGNVTTETSPTTENTSPIGNAATAKTPTENTDTKNKPAFVYVKIIEINDSSGDEGDSLSLLRNVQPSYQGSQDSFVPTTPPQSTKVEQERVYTPPPPLEILTNNGEWVLDVPLTQRNSVVSEDIQVQVEQTQEQIDFRLLLERAEAEAQAQLISNTRNSVRERIDKFFTKISNTELADGIKKRFVALSNHAQDLLTIMIDYAVNGNEPTDNTDHILDNATKKINSLIKQLSELELEQYFKGGKGVLSEKLKPLLLSIRNIESSVPVRERINKIDGFLDKILDLIGTGADLLLGEQKQLATVKDESQKNIAENLEKISTYIHKTRFSEQIKNAFLAVIENIKVVSELMIDMVQNPNDIIKQSVEEKINKLFEGLEDIGFEGRVKELFFQEGGVPSNLYNKLIENAQPFQDVLDKHSAEEKMNKINRIIDFIDIISEITQMIPKFLVEQKVNKIEDDAKNKIEQLKKFIVMLVSSDEISDEHKTGFSEKLQGVAEVYSDLARYKYENNLDFLNDVDILDRVDEMITIIEINTELNEELLNLRAERCKSEFTKAYIGKAVASHNYAVSVEKLQESAKRNHRVPFISPQHTLSGVLLPSEELEKLEKLDRENMNLLESIREDIDLKEKFSEEYQKQMKQKMEEFIRLFEE